MKERLLWIDALRGILIVLVVLGHTLQHGDYENRLTWNMVNSFHVAAFFVVSGYISYKKEYSIGIIGHKAQQLLLPFFVWSVLSMVFVGNCKLQSLVKYIIKPDTGYWFVCTLFFVSSIAIILQKSPFKKDFQKSLILVLGGVILVSVTIATNCRLFGFHFISYYFLFYVMGLLIRKYDVKLNNFYFTIMGILWLYMAIFWRKHDCPVIVNWVTFLPSSIVTYVYRMITAFCGSLFALEFARRYINTPNRLIKSFSYMGTISLGVYIIHLFLGRVAGSAYLNMFSSNTDITFVIIDFTLKLGAGVAFTWLISQFSIPSFVLLGKYIKK